MYKALRGHLLSHKEAVDRVYVYGDCFQLFFSMFYLHCIAHVSCDVYFFACFQQGELELDCHDESDSEHKPDDYAPKPYAPKKDYGSLSVHSPRLRESGHKILARILREIDATMQRQLPTSNCQKLYWTMEWPINISLPSPPRQRGHPRKQPHPIATSTKPIQKHGKGVTNILRYLCCDPSLGLITQRGRIII